MTEQRICLPEIIAHAFAFYHSKNRETHKKCKCALCPALRRSMMTETNEKEDCMKRNVWLTVHGEQQYEGMSADSSNLRVRGTMEETRDGYLLRYEETDGDGKVTTATRLALAPDCIILTRTGEVTSEMVFAEGKEHTSFYAVPYGTLPVAVKAESVKWKLDEDGGMLTLRLSLIHI